MEGKGSRVPPTILKKKTKLGGTSALNFKTHHTAAVIKAAWYWQKDRHTDQWDRRGNLEVNPDKYAQLGSFNKGAKITQHRKDSLSTSCAEAIKHP